MLGDIMPKHAAVLILVMTIIIFASVFVSKYATYMQSPLMQAVSNYVKNGDEKVIIYVIGDVSKELEELAKRIKANIVRYAFLKEMPVEKGIVIITRKLSPSEEKIVSQLLKRMFVVITLNKEAKKQIDRILSKIATLSVTFNGTKVYMYKLISAKPVKKGRYPVMIKGYAGSNITYDVLKDAIRTLKYGVSYWGTYESSDWKIIGFVSWSSREQWKPYGKLNLEHAILYYTPDPWNNMDLYVVRCVTEIISGAKLGWTDGANVWFNDYIESHYYLNYYTNIYDLRDYSPSSMNNVPVQIVVSLALPPGISITWSYPGNYIVSISSEGDLGANIAGWIHDLGGFLYAHATKETVKIEPGFEFTVSPEITGKQRWVISGQWVAFAYPHPYPYKPFKGTVVIELVLYYG